MSTVTINPAPLIGAVSVPSSKSFVHRQLIAAALSDGPTTVCLSSVSEDVQATVNCLSAMGAKIASLPDDTGFIVHPIPSANTECSLFCNESGSTLRFLLPVAAALGLDAVFTGSGRLPGRPNKPLLSAMASHGVHVCGDRLPVTLSGRLQGGVYEMPGHISSQYITGLLLALPLCAEDSRIIFTSRLESAPYVDITCHVLNQFGIRYQALPDGFSVPGKQHYHSPGKVFAEGDWSSAVFWHCANAMGHAVEIQGVNPHSCQGDRAILWQLQAIGGEIDVSQTPDSFPALAAAAAAHPGITRFTGIARLRLKESDRILATCNMLYALGIEARTDEDCVTVKGGTPISGGIVDGCNDHRIVMAAALLASVANGPVAITDAHAIRKSYPSFFNHFSSLGGIIHG